MPNAYYATVSTVRTHQTARRASARGPALAVAAKWESTVRTHASSTSPSCSDCITATPYESPSRSASSRHRSATKHSPRQLWPLQRATKRVRAMCTGRHGCDTPSAVLCASCLSAEVRGCGRVTHATPAVPHASAATRWSSPAAPDTANQVPRADSEDDCQWSRGQNRAPPAPYVLSVARPSAACTVVRCFTGTLSAC